MFVPDEFALEFDDFADVVVERAGDAGAPVVVEGDRSQPPGIPSHTPSSARLSKELKKRGWSFVGPTTMYAFMQSVGLVNDHLDGCDVRSQVNVV